MSKIVFMVAAAALMLSAGVAEAQNNRDDYYITTYCGNQRFLPFHSDASTTPMYPHIHCDVNKDGLAYFAVSKGSKDNIQIVPNIGTPSPALCNEGLATAQKWVGDNKDNPTIKDNVAAIKAVLDKFTTNKECEKVTGK